MAYLPGALRLHDRRHRDGGDAAVLRRQLGRQERPDGPGARLAQTASGERSRPHGVARGKGESWKVEAQTITELLAHTRLWKHRIRFPGDPAGETTIGSAGMVGSLKQILATPYFGAISTQNRVKILEAYWEGVERVIPEAFKEPTAFAIQKSTGVQIMHALLVSALELLRSKGMSVVEPESYESALQDSLTNLEGDTAEGDTAEGGPALGADFWRSGPNGAAGSFSSNAGRRVLISRLRADLPPVEVE